MRCTLKKKTQFEVVAITEVLEKMAEAGSTVERTTRKEEPYGVPVRAENTRGSCKLPRELKYGRE